MAGEKNTVSMKEKVTVMKFDKSKEDNPTEPSEVIVQETITEVPMSDAIAMGFVPKEDNEVEASGTVKLGGGDTA